jgi:L-lactate dehydrogenase complex protein LldG
MVRVYGEVWRQFRERCGEDWQRTVNWVTGWSQTADIDQYLLLGAHGPSKLYVVLVDAKTK